MSAIVIVAIPAEDEPVWKVSSEKVPHMTLLYMEGPLDNEENTLLYIQHAIETSLSRFGMSVDRRGKLGSDDADVLFFDKSYCGKELLAFRSFLLQNDSIKQAYSKAEQYPMWTPHLTLGYPATPAHEEPEDNWGLKWINFDRIAVWTSDYDGPEFVLKKDSHRELEIDGAWSDTPGDGLLHWGIKNPFKESSVKRDKGGQFAKTAAVDLDNLPDDYSSTTYTDGSGYTHTEESYTDEYGNAIVNTTKTDAAGNSTVSMKVNGKEAPEIVNFDKLRKGIDKALQDNRPGAFNKKAKLDTSQVTNKGHDLSTKDNLKRVGRSVETLVRKKADQILGKETKLEKSHREYLERQKKLGHSEETLDDVLMHFGVRGMRWGVRRSVGSNGLVEGTVAGAIRSGQHPHTEGSSSAPVTKGRKAVSSQTHSEDHKKMTESLNKKVEELSNDEIRQLTTRIRAVNDYHATTAAEREAKKSTGKKLTAWALNQVKAGAKNTAEGYIREFTGDTLKGLLPKTTTQKAKDQKEQQKQEDRKIKMEDRAEQKAKDAQKAAKKQSADAPRAKETRDEAVQELVYEITTLKKKGG